MFGKISGCFLLVVLLLDPSSAFLAEKCDFHLVEVDKLLKQGNVSPQLVLKAVRVLRDIFKENPDLEKEYPWIKEFVQQLVQQGSKIITAANLAFFGATVYLGVVVFTSYCFLVHSQEQLAEAHLIDKSLDLTIEGEVKPILLHIEMLLRNGQENFWRNFCNIQLKKAKEMLKDRKYSIQNILDNIKNIRKKSIEGKEQSSALRIASVAGAFIGVGVVIAARIAAPASVLVAGTFGTAGFLGYNRFDTSKRKYEETLKCLKKTENKAFEAQKAITLLQTIDELACSIEFRKLESEFKWNLMLEAEEQKKTGAEMTNEMLKPTNEKELMTEEL